MERNVNLLTGDITKSLTKLAMPLMGTAFIQMAYSLTDVMWLGRLSTNAVAAVGTCSFFVWISNAITLIAKTGVSVGLAQAFGREDEGEARDVMNAGFYVNLFLCLTVMAILLFFKEEIIGFYSLPEDVHTMAVSYLTVVGAGMIFTFMNPLLSATFFARGNSVTPFKVSVTALVLNIVADPLLIFGIGPFPELGTRGAAVATVLAQGVGTVILLAAAFRQCNIFRRTDYRRPPKGKVVERIVQLGVPSCLQTSIHAGVSIVLNKYIAEFGPKAIAVYTIGSQIESLSWMTAEGFSTAISAFTGQNYGAGKFERIDRGYKIGLRIVCSLGLISALLLFFGNESLFQIFLPGDPKTIEMGGEYLRILSASQVFMSVEIGTAGALNGLSLTRFPAINGAVFNICRIPFSLFLMPKFHVNGIWVAMSLTSILKGIFAFTIFWVIHRKTDGFRVNMEKYISN